MPAETWVVFARAMRQQLRNPVWVFFGLSQPVLFLVLFGPLLENVSGAGLGGDNAWAVFVPGLLLQLVIFTGGFAGFGIIQELREGVVERQRVTPARRSSLILGRALYSTVTIGAQGLILCLLAIPFGLDASIGGVALSLVLLMLLTLGVSSASYALGLVLKDEDSFAPVIQGLSMPAMLLSGVFLPMALAPGWLKRLSEANPLTYSLDAFRALFQGEVASSTVTVGVGITVALTALLAWWATRAFTRSAA